MTQQVIKQPKVIQAKHHTLSYEEKTLVMGILNVTPDSFSDGGNNQVDKALAHGAKTADRRRAHIIDIGGESTAQEHLFQNKRSFQESFPSSKKITKELDVPISIDTYKAHVADEAVKAGASIINDVWGAKADHQMADVASRSTMFRLFNAQSTRAKLHTSNFRYDRRFE
ncbi:dihydropteroate synthase [Bacillus sp. SL00103]